MNNLLKIKATVSFLDWNSIIKIVLISLCIITSILFFLNFGYVRMLWLAKGMNKEGYGQIIAREAKFNTTQSLTGNKSSIQFIKCTYKYKINGIVVQDSYNLEYSLINSEKLNKIKTNPLPISIKIKYSTKYPYRSMIWIP